MKGIFAAIAGVCLLFYGLHFYQAIVNQEDNLFQGATLSEERVNQVNEAFPSSEEIRIEADGAELHGWFLPSSLDGQAPLFIYFGGNAEEASRAMESLPLPDEWHGLFVNYRGYGKSTGEPSQEAFYSDAEALFDFGASHHAVDESMIVSAGRSMGTGTAAYLAAEKPVAASILISPYDSRKELQQHRHPWLPVGTFIRHPFPVSTMAETVETPLLVFTGSEDMVIPPEHSLVTADAWAGETDHIQLSGYDHNNLTQAEDFHSAFSRYLQDLREDNG
ncbi:alpha/beta hydrolase [Bacillus daqingensis]|uniref:Alpha/beta hydrolase n=1 Tax=Bacillus daqingensis TaxID=872396 RepID=A0ABV9P023_9BACI